MSPISDGDRRQSSNDLSQLTSRIMILMETDGEDSVHDDTNNYRNIYLKEVFLSALANP